MRRIAFLLTACSVTGCGLLHSSAYSCSNATCKVKFSGAGEQDVTDSLGPDGRIAFDGTSADKARVRMGTANLRLAEGESTVVGEHKVTATTVDGDKLTLRVEPR